MPLLPAQECYERRCLQGKVNDVTIYTEKHIKNLSLVLTLLFHIPSTLYAKKIPSKPLIGESL